VEGMVNLEIKTIAAVGCDSTDDEASTNHTNYPQHHILAVSIVVVVALMRLIVSKTKPRNVQTARYEEIQDGSP
jgi:hypothetical protein